MDQSFRIKIIYEMKIDIYWAINVNKCLFIRYNFIYILLIRQLIFKVTSYTFLANSISKNQANIIGFKKQNRKVNSQRFSSLMTLSKLFLKTFFHLSFYGSNFLILNVKMRQRFV